MSCVFTQAAVAQSVAHLIGSEEVTGSIPVSSFHGGNLAKARLPAVFCCEPPAPRRIWR